MIPAPADGFQRSVAEGLEIRLFTFADAGALFQLTDLHREYLRQWLPWVDGTQSAEDVRRFIHGVVTPQWRENRGPHCGIWVDGALSGSIGCHPIDWQNMACSVGYWIAPQHQGRGLVTRCTAALADYLFGELRLHRVVIQCGEGNHRSGAIPQRLGFTREGVLRQAQWVNNHWVDLVVWSMLEPQWRERSASGWPH